MSSRNNLLKYKLVDAASMGANVTSLATAIQYMDNIAIQINFTGTPTGVFSIEGSVDHEELNGVVKTAGNWVAITLPSSPVASGAAGSILLDLNQLSFPFIRVVYTRTSGAGSLDVFIAGKSV